MNVGDPVEFDSKRHGTTIQGVITAFPKSKGARVSVETVTHGSMVVPATMLRPAKIDPKTKAKVEAKGSAFQAARTNSKASAHDTNVIRGRAAIDHRRLTAGAHVTYDAPNGRQKTFIVSVDRDAGKVTIGNPKVNAREYGAALGFDISHLANVRDTLTVWAHRCTLSGG